MFPMIKDPRNWNERNHTPNMVPIEIGTNVSRGSTAIAHKLKASTGTRGKRTTNRGSTKDDRRSIVNLATARVPKYSARMLFLEVIAYILGLNRISWSSGADEHDAPQRNEDIGEK